MFDSVRVSARGNAEVLVVGQFQGESLDRATARLDPDGSMKEAAGLAEATGELGSIAEGRCWDAEHERVIIVGLGDKDGFNQQNGPERLRTAMGAVGRRLARIKATSVQIELGGPLSTGRGKAGKVDAAVGGQAVGEAFGLLSWNYDELRGKATTLPKRGKLNLRSSDDAFTKGLKRGLALAEGSNTARRLSQTPPNIATPDWIAKEARAMARKAGLKCTVMSGKKLEDERMTGLINVGKASENKPCMIRLEYTPARAKRGAKPIVLVGKTMTYDSGGLSIKVGGGMRG
jgi:leucyl aminopeptidase